MVKSWDQQVHQAKRKKRMEKKWEIIIHSRKKRSGKIKRTEVVSVCNLTHVSINTLLLILYDNDNKYPRV